MSAVERDLFIDRFKGILIFLVVVGHLAGGMAHFAAPVAAGFLSYIYKLIYIFHMPAFFVVAGLVWKMREESFGSFAKKRIFRLLVPYLIWGVISVVILVFMTEILEDMRSSANDSYYKEEMLKFSWWVPFISLLHAGGWPHGNGFRANSVLWFLPCMFTVQILCWAALRAVKSKLALVLTLIMSFILGGALQIYRFQNLPWGISLAPFYLGFMLLGVIISNRVKEIRPSKKLAITTLVGVLFFLLIGLLLPNMWVVWAYWKWYWINLLLAICGITLSGLAAKVVGCKLLARLGAVSMGVMLIHKFLIMALQVCYPRLDNVDDGAWIAVCAVLSIVVTVAAMVIAQVVGKFAPWSFGEKGSGI